MKKQIQRKRWLSLLLSLMLVLTSCPAAAFGAETEGGGSAAAPDANVFKYVRITPPADKKMHAWVSKISMLSVFSS